MSGLTLHNLRVLVNESPDGEVFLAAIPSKYITRFGVSMNYHRGELRRLVLGTIHGSNLTLVEKNGADVLVRSSDAKRAAAAAKMQPGREFRKQQPACFAEERRMHEEEKARLKQETMKAEKEVRQARTVMQWMVLAVTFVLVMIIGPLL
jgi:hypothetical protein